MDYCPEGQNYVTCWKMVKQCETYFLRGGHGEAHAENHSKIQAARCLVNIS